MTRRKTFLWSGLACFAVGGGWFLLMAILPGTFPFVREFGWIFLPGIALLWLGNRGRDGDEVWPIRADADEGPFQDWVRDVSMDGGGDD